MKMERLNPSVKAATVLICVILLSFQYQVSLNLTVFFTSLILLIFFSNAKLKTVMAILLPAFAAALALFFMGLYYAKGNSVTQLSPDSMEAMPYAVRAALSTNLYTAGQLASRLLAYAGFGVLFSLTTDGEMFIYSLMHQCRLSPKFAYGILAAVHLMPAMVRELRQVRLAFRTRGIRTGVFSMKVLFAMLVNSVRWSESVAMAMESCGFCGEAKRTCYRVSVVRWYDWLVSALCVGGIAAGSFLLRF